MAHGKSVVDRAQNLRELAEGAENLVHLTSLADATLERARQDLLVLAGAARGLAGRLEQAADAMEVAP